MIQQIYSANSVLNPTNAIQQQIKATQHVLELKTCVSSLKKTIQPYFVFYLLIMLNLNFSLNYAFGLVLAVSCCLSSYSQDLSTIGEKPIWKEAKLSGGIGGSLVGYDTKGQAAQRPPFYWIVNANVNIDIYGMAIPFSATFTSQNQDFAQPFNQFGMSPKYKWVTAHLGFRSMQFSQYSLAGLNFLGAGVELEIPDTKFKVKAMGGRLIKAIPLTNGLNVVSEDPAFERWGYGANVEYKYKSGQIGFSVFKAQDLISSINTDSLLLLKPAENVVSAITFQQKIGKRLSFNGEYALSAYTRDRRLEAVQSNEFGYQNNFGWLIESNSSTVTNSAFTGNLTYAIKSHSFGVTYRRVGPEYESMGAAFLNNDVEEVTGNIATSILKRKVNLAGSLGLQRNNLADNLYTNDRRIIGSGNVTWAISNKVMLSGLYSNYRATSDPSALNVRDTIRFIQVTANYGIVATYSTASEKFGHNVVLSNNYQQANSISAGDLQTVENGSEFYNSNLSYTFTLVPKQLNITAAANYNQFLSPGIVNEAIGPTVAVSKPFLKKSLTAMVAYSLFNNYLDKEFQDTSSNIMASIGYNIKNHHQIKLDGRLMAREGNNSTPIEEIQAGLSYNYTF